MNIMKFLGFENEDEDYENDNDYEDRSRKNKTKRDSKNTSGSNKLILFRGIANDSEKRKLCEAYNDGAMILIDMHDLNRSEYDESGKDFITFMGGVAYAHDGEMKHIKPAQYLLTPRAGMFEIWPEGESSDE